MLEALPDGRYLQVLSMMDKREILMSMEKNAEVSEKLYSRESSIVGSFYKLAFRRVKSAGDNKALIKLAGEALYQGGRDFARAANLSVNLQGLEDTLQKLAAIGELNAKLQIAVDSPVLSEDAKNQAIKLGSENSRLCLETLEEIVKYAGDSTGSKWAAAGGAGKVLGFAQGTGNPNLNKGGSGGSSGSSLGSEIAKGMKADVTHDIYTSGSGGGSGLDGPATNGGHKYRNHETDSQSANFKTGAGAPDITGGIAKTPSTIPTAGSMGGGGSHTKHKAMAAPTRKYAPGYPRTQDGLTDNGPEVK